MQELNSVIQRKGKAKMIGYGFGYDPEVPSGFQDADLEMREFEARANEKHEYQCRECGEIFILKAGENACPECEPRTGSVQTG